MQRTMISGLESLRGSVATLCGFVETVRDQKRMQFVVLRDSTGAIQLVHQKGTNVELDATIAKLTTGSAIRVSGLVVENAQAKLGGHEVRIDELIVESLAQSPLPIGHDSSPELHMDHRQLSIRFPENLLIFKVQTALEEGMRRFWSDEGFLEIHSPKLLATASESGAELFKLPYFNRQTACLAQSPQFYKQMAMAAGMNRVFEIGPVFRANPSFTSRHDTEFTSVDFEISWITSHEDVMAMEERWLNYAIAHVVRLYGDEIKAAFGVSLTVPRVPFPRLPLAEACELLAKLGKHIPAHEDLDPEGERMVAQQIKEQHGHEFVFVTDYPIEVRPFYHMRYPDNPRVTKSFDLLWKGLEVTTGAQREHRYELLRQQAVEKNIELEPIDDYLGFFRFGCPPHGGAGIGLTRLLMVMLGSDNVRRVTYLYRGPNRLRP